MVRSFVTILEAKVIRPPGQYLDREPERELLVKEVPDFSRGHVRLRRGRCGGWREQGRCHRDGQEGGRLHQGTGSRKGLSRIYRQGPEIHRSRSVRCRLSTR